MSLKTLFLVKGTTGTICETAQTWSVAAYFDEHLADQHCLLATAAAKDIIRRNPDERYYLVEPNRYDLECVIADQFIRYSVEKVLLVEGELGTMGLFPGALQVARPSVPKQSLVDSSPTNTMADKLRAALAAH